MSNHRKDRECADARCRRPIVGGKTGYCCHCYQKHQVSRSLKFSWTPEWDRLLREAYARCLVGKPTVAINKLQAITGYPRYIVTLRAQRLGITRDMRRPWKQEEIFFLDQQAGKLSVRAIATALHRSYESVRAMMEHRKIRTRLTYGYGIIQLSDLLGVSPGQVRRYLKCRWIAMDAEHRILPRTVRAMLVEHMDSIDFRLVNQKWLKDELRLTITHLVQNARRAA